MINIKEVKEKNVGIDLIFKLARYRITAYMRLRPPAATSAYITRVYRKQNYTPTQRRIYAERYLKRQLGG